jgi:hypothetical protein
MAARTTRRWLGCAAAILFALGPLARAGDGIWSALVLATNEHPPKAAPASLKPFAAGLHTVFGYNTYYLVGSKELDLSKGSAAWVVPAKEVFLKLRCIDRTPTMYHVQIDLYVRKQLVVTSEVKLAPGAPLYIRGPAWGKGRLVFILQAD